MIWASIRTWDSQHNRLRTYSHTNLTVPAGAWLDTVKAVAEEVEAVAIVVPKL